MNAPYLTLTQLNSSAAELNGQMFTIKGQLVAGKEITIDISEGSSTVKLLIDDPSLMKRMLATCSMWLGGPVFDDPAVIVGTLAGREDGTIYVSSVESGTLHQPAGENMF